MNAETHIQILCIESVSNRSVPLEIWEPHGRGGGMVVGVRRNEGQQKMVRWIN